MAVRPRPRLHATRKAELRLRTFWVERLEYSEAPEDGAHEPEVRISRPEVLADPDDAGHLVVRMRVEIATGDRTLDVTGSGEFEVGNLTDDEVAAYLTFNAPAILLGAIRGVVASVSGLGSAGRLDLPTLNLAD